MHHNRRGTGNGTAVAHLSVSGPFLAIIIFSLPSPPTGALSVPVVNCRKRHFCSSPNECNVSQNSLRHKHEETPSSNIYEFSFKTLDAQTYVLRLNIQVNGERGFSLCIFLVFQSKLSWFLRWSLCLVTRLQLHSEEEAVLMSGAEAQ